MDYEKAKKRAEEQFPQEERDKIVSGLSDVGGQEISGYNEGLILLVCGGRDYTDYERVCEVLNFFLKKHGIELIVHGGATGADSLAQRWAEEHNIKTKIFYADWKKHGRAAGPLRNQQMLEQSKPDKVIVFEGGRGTADMVSRAKTAKVKVVIA